MTRDARRVGGYTVRRGKFYARVRIGKGTKRYEPPMSGVKTEEAAKVRAAQIAKVVDMFLGAGRIDDARKYAKSIGAADTERDVLSFLRAVDMLCAQSSAIAYGGLTFAQFAERWTSGQLHRDHPDHVAAKQSEGDINILKNRINPLVGPLPIASFSLEDADRVMRELPAPPAISKAYRRAVAQVVHRVLSLAVYPAKVIKANPLPKGWLPKLGRPKAKSFLYPKEEAALLANVSISIGYRMLIGFLCREGMRKSEATALSWEDIDLVVGTVTLDVNKTDAPRSWPLDAGVVRALARWKKMVGGAGPFVSVDVQHLGEAIRRWLFESGVTRPQLFKASEQRMHFRAHDTRSTFVTLSLSEGKSEAWIMRRTAHRSSTMIARYAVSAANAQELGLGPLQPMDVAVVGLTKTRALAQTGEQRVNAQAKKRTNRAPR